ncbi:hypothetical protein [Inquilinus sp. CAU 1745]|uniref:hypothetical protein n=1 Tax=Inquilinus sp. CAU 1745 TaxID=3140369 RepID=UPI00325C019C
MPDPAQANDPNPWVIAIYAAGFGVAFLLNLWNWLRLSRADAWRRRGDEAGVDYPAGPGLMARRRPTENVMDEKLKRQESLRRIRRYRGRLPAGFRFDRGEANERG